MRRVALAGRALALCLLLAAPFAPRWHRAGEARSVVYVVDRSDSVGDADRELARRFVDEAIARRGEVGVGIVGLGARPDLQLAVGTDPARRRDQGPYGPAPGTDIAAAIRLAGAALPDGGQRRIVLLSDGRGTRGDALAEVRRARAGGILVDVVPLGEGDSAGAALTHVEVVRPRVADGEPVDVVASVRGPAGARVRVVWSRDDREVETSWVDLDARGDGEARLVDPAPSGVHVYKALLAEPPYDEATRAVAIVAGKPRVLVLTTGGERPTLLCDALERAGAETIVRSLAEGEPDAAALSALDLVVLADVPIARAGEVTLLQTLSVRGQEDLVEFARAGGGVIVTGGTYGFAPEWASAPIARMLPVEIADEGEIEDPRLAMAIMLDRSGSMGAYAGSHSKMQLAVEAALAAASTLQADDLVAIASIDTVTTWNAPLGPASLLPTRQGAIRAIDAGGGGIYVYTALADAYAALRATTTPVRHVVLFSDTADSEEQFQGCPFRPCDPQGASALSLARTARDAGITTSVVGIGDSSDSDTQFLRDLATTAGGRFYLTSKGTDLRRIFVSETRAAARSNVRAEDVQLAVLAADHEILSGIDAAAMPPIGGFVQTGRRATADTVLAAPDGEPVLAAWRYGLGQVVALTTEAGGEWTARWASWPGTGQMMRQMGRFAMRRSAAGGADASLSVRDEAVDLTIDVADEDAAAPASVELFAVSDQGHGKPLAARLERVAPGRWSAKGRPGADLEPFVIARVRDARGRLLAETVGGRDFLAESWGNGPDTRALRELARAGAGLYAPTPIATLRTAGPRGREPVPTWPFALLGAALLVTVDLWLRRLPPRRPVAARATGPGPAGSAWPEERQRVHGREAT